MGQNTKIRDTLNNLILKSPQSWQTSVGLPYFQITGTVVEWDEVRFDVRLMQRVPYEGTSRMQTSLRRRQRDRVVRRSVPLPSNSVFNSQPLPKCASTDRVRSSVPEQRSGDDDRVGLLRDRCWSSALCRS